MTKAKFEKECKKGNTVITFDYVTGANNSTAVHGDVGEILEVLAIKNTVALIQCAESLKDKPDECRTMCSTFLQTISDLFVDFMNKAEKDPNVWKEL